MLPPVDFRAISPVRFNVSPPLPGVSGGDTQSSAGRTFLRTVTKHRMAGIKRASEILDVLPGEGESLHVLLRGFFDALNVVLALLDKLAVPCDCLRVATLSLSKKNVSELAALLDAGTVKKIEVITSDFQAEHDGDILSELLAELRDQRGQRVATARSHCKIVLLAMSDGSRYTMEGSANLRTSRNMEQFCLSRDAALHDFYATWFDDTVNGHEIRQDNSTQAD